MPGVLPRRAKAFAVALAVIIALCATLPVALAHGVRCPVCGMPVDDHTTKWKTTWNGQTYFFCMEEDQKAFEAAPERYAGVLKLTRKVGERVVVATIRPRAPRVGDTVRVHVQVAPVASDGMSAFEGEALVTSSVRAMVWTLDRSRPPRARPIRLQPEGEGRVQGMALLTSEPRPVRLRLEVLVRGGEELLAYFDVPVVPATGAEESHAHEAGAPEHGHGTAPPPGEAPPDPDAPLTMEAQHLSMKVMARRWDQVDQELASERPDRDRAVHAIDEIEAWRRVMPRFSLHKFAEQKAEYDALAGSFGDQLAILRTELEAGRWTEARDAWRQIDANHCTRCHVKFRWAITTDLKDFPDLTRGAGHGH